MKLGANIRKIRELSINSALANENTETFPDDEWYEGDLDELIGTGDNGPDDSEEAEEDYTGNKYFKEVQTVQELVITKIKASASLNVGVGLGMKLTPALAVQLAGNVEAEPVDYYKVICHIHQDAKRKFCTSTGTEFLRCASGGCPTGD